MAKAAETFCLGIVPARGGSKGLPGKNLACIGGKSLIRRAAEAGLKSGCCTRIVCSTDEHAIAAEARAAGIEVPFLRPAELAGDDVPMAEVLIHAAQQVEAKAGRQIDFLCLLQPTSPLRTALDVRNVRCIWRSRPHRR